MEEYNFNVLHILRKFCAGLLPKKTMPLSLVSLCIGVIGKQWHSWCAGGGYDIEGEGIEHVSNFTVKMTVFLEA